MGPFSVGFWKSGSYTDLAFPPASPSWVVCIRRMDLWKWSSSTEARCGSLWFLWNKHGPRPCLLTVSSVYSVEIVCVSVSPFWVVVSSREQLVGCVPLPRSASSQTAPLPAQASGVGPQLPAVHPCRARPRRRSGADRNCVQVAVVRVSQVPASIALVPGGLRQGLPVFRRYTGQRSVTPTGWGIQTGVCGCGTPQSMGETLHANQIVP